MSQDDYREQADIANSIWKDRPENIGGGLDYIDDQRELERVIADDREFGGVIPGQLRREAAEASADDHIDWSRIEVPPNPTTDEEFAALPVLDLSVFDERGPLSWDEDGAA